MLIPKLDTVMIDMVSCTSVRSTAQRGERALRAECGWMQPWEGRVLSSGERHPQLRGRSESGEQSHEVACNRIMDTTCLVDLRVVFVARRRRLVGSVRRPRDER